MLRSGEKAGLRRRGPCVMMGINQEGVGAMLDYICWDWNGTLLDDVSLCVAVMDGMLQRRGLPSLGGEARYREIFTFPVQEYYRAAGFDFGREPFEKLALEYIEEYDRRALDCPLHAGAAEVLEALEAQGLRQLIVSASKQKALEEQVGHAGVRGFFEALLGLEDSFARSKSGLALQYFSAHAVDARRVLFIGDTLHDWEVAQEAGCPCVLLAQGHQSRARLETAGVPVLESLPAGNKKDAPPQKPRVPYQPTGCPMLRRLFFMLAFKCFDEYQIKS